MDYWDIVNWWWTLDVTSLAVLCIELGGTQSDALLVFPPDYVLAAVEAQPGLLELPQ